MSTATASSSAWLALRSLFWTVAFPGMVAGYIPWRFLGVDRAPIDVTNPAHVAGLTLVAAGAALLAACIVEFARSGRGTLSPADPPRQLVVRGLSRHVRNPMYLAVSTIVLGEALWTHSMALVRYWLFFFVCVNIFVMGYEEPYLRSRFGASYDEYTRSVGRWIPKIPQR